MRRPRPLGQRKRGSAWFEGIELPLVGRVSLDTITLGTSALPEGALRPGTPVDLIDGRHGVDAVAARAGARQREGRAQLDWACSEADSSPLRLSAERTTGAPRPVHRSEGDNRWPVQESIAWA